MKKPFEPFDMSQRFIPCSGQSQTKPFGDERDWTTRRDWSVHDSSSYEARFWRPHDARGRIKLFTYAGACAYADKLNRGEISP